MALSCLAILVDLLFVNPAPATAATLTFTQVSAGHYSSCGVTAAGAAYCWGQNTYGKLGNGTTTDSSNPVLVSGGYTFASVSMGIDHACGVTTGGAAYCWGKNNIGQLGSWPSDTTVPSLVSGGYTWASISAGWDYTCGVTTGGVGYCWGWNSYSTLGDGSNWDSSSPTLVAGGHTWASIDAGYMGTCGVTTGRTGYCWGANDNGWVGDNSTTARNSPTLVSGGLTWASISMGNHHSCGVTTAGAAYCWGQNNGGQVGDGTTFADRLVPTAVSGGYTWAAVSAGYDQTCGLRNNGVMYCWGWGTDGNIGDGTNNQAVVPVAVSGSYNWSAISSGGAHSCAMTNIGVVYCWGYNGYGQIGDGTTTSRNVPTTTYFIASTTTVSATVDPSFSFTVANQSSACNGESNFASSAGTATTVALGHLAVSSNVSGGQALSVSSNASDGFVVYIRGTQASTNLRSSGHNWADVTGTYASPAALGAGERFGYTFQDATASTSVTNPASATFAALDNATTNKVMGSTTSQSGSGCVSFDAQTAAATPAGSYTATVIYTAVPSF